MKSYFCIDSCSNYFCLKAGPDCRTPPKSAGELVANFSKEERLALYEYTLKHAAPVVKPPELLSPEEVLHSHNPTSGDLTPLELKKAMRDFKRRRQAYRTKVSTKNKSQVQVTREIIHNMMVFLGTEEIEHKTESGTQPSHSDGKRKLSSSPRDDIGSEASVLMDSKKIKREDSSHCEYKSSEKLSKEDKKRYNKDKYYVHKKNTSFDDSSRSSHRKGDAKVIPDNSSRTLDDVKELQSKRKSKNFEKAKYRRSSSGSSGAEDERNGNTRHSKKRKLKKSKRKKSKSKKSHKHEYSTSEDT